MDFKDTPREELREISPLLARLKDEAGSRSTAPPQGYLESLEGLNWAALAGAESPPAPKPAFWTRQRVFGGLGLVAASLLLLLYGPWGAKTAEPQGLDLAQAWAELPADELQDYLLEEAHTLPLESLGELFTEEAHWQDLAANLLGESPASSNQEEEDLDDWHIW